MFCFHRVCKRLRSACFRQLSFYRYLVRSAFYLKLFGGSNAYFPCILGISHLSKSFVFKRYLFTQ